MKIAGMQKFSTIDYPGLLSAVVFANGCNYNCWYCHNSQFIDGNANNVDQSEVISFLEKRRKLLDGVVISGGEPTLQADLSDFIYILKQMDFLIKLDTNGSNPAVLSACMSSIDYVAIDYKAPKALYMKICGEIDYEMVKESLLLLGRSALKWEIRTTMVPEVAEKITAIKQELSDMNFTNRPVMHRLNNFHTACESVSF